MYGTRSSIHGTAVLAGRMFLCVQCFRMDPVVPAILHSRSLRPKFEARLEGAVNEGYPSEVTRRAT